MKNVIILLCMLFFAAPLQLMAQGSEFVIKGHITDKTKVSIPGVNVYVKNSPGIGVATDPDGNYQIRAKVSDVLVFSFVGYRTKEILIDKEMAQLNVVMEEEAEVMDQVEVVGYGTQRKISVVGAVTSIDVEKLKSSSVTSISNALAGRMAGIIGVQRSGEPGSDVSEFWIRGISTFGAKSEALFLIDGVERTKSDFDNLLPEDIESFSILKDATATAVYGARGANGVVLITTKRGKEGRMSISANVKAMVEYLPKLPDYLRAYDYATLANEARLVRGEAALYDNKMFEVIKHHLDDNFYPDVDWQKELLKRATWGLQANVNVSGGGSIARYFMSLSYRTNDAAYKESNIHKYNTNILRHQYSFRSNIDVNVTKTTSVGLNLSTTIVNMNRPGIGSTSQIWAAQANMNPLTVPMVYSNGLLPAYGDGDQASPWVLLNETGFVTEFSSTTQSTLRLDQNLNMITKGLSASASISFDAGSSHTNTRSKMPDLYRATGYNAKGELITKRTVASKPITFTTSSSGTRRVYLEGRIHYERAFDIHRLSALVLYNQGSYNSTSYTDEISSIPRRTQGIAGRVTYSYNDIYLSEFNFGYNGTENFPKGQRFGFFPSMAIGWVPSNYQFVKDHVPFLSLLKFRYSFGAVGNDELKDRFPYLTYVGSTGGYAFGDRGENSFGGIGVTRVGSEGLVWEKARKHNLGLDLGLWDRVSVEIDYFRDLRKGIFMERSQLPDIMGIPNTPYGNVGKMRNSGVDGTMSYEDHIGKVNFEVRGNFTVTKNKILDYDEPNYKYPYLSKKGKGYDITYGYISLGYFKDEADIANSPQHMGDVMPGDIKYKDVNGDGVINDQDIVPIGNSNVPRIQYGFAASVNYKNFDLNVFFRGSGGVDFFYGGSGYFPFQSGETGNVLSVVNDPSQRWVPASYSGDPSTENPDARFPRLAYGNHSANKNNYVNSTHWLANGAYLRLKTVELGYSLPKNVAAKIFMKSLRASIIADNLHVWDKVKLWDPEQASSNGAGYPLTRSFTLNLQMTF